MDKDLFKFKASVYNFKLPEKLIAQEPHSPRDKSRLLVVNRGSNKFTEKVFKDITCFFQKGDCLVLNNTKVIKARIFGKKDTGAKIEVLLVKEVESGLWECLLRPVRRVKLESNIFFAREYQAKVKGRSSSGLFYLQFYPKQLQDLIKYAGRTPLPPYIKKKARLSQYQTTYAKKAGAVAAPTAGLHFTKELLQKIKAKGVEIVYITLHCGLGTFIPVKVEDIREHNMFPEYLELSSEAAIAVNKAKKNKKKVFAVGTTVVRSLESAVQFKSKLYPFFGPTNLYITPGYKFKVVDRLITNFHTPLSTNLILVSSFACPSLINKAYSYAKRKNFRFFSFGDAMLIL